MDFYLYETFGKLYKRDSKGKIRIWQMELGTEDGYWAHRTISGLADGKIVISAWKIVKGKNKGRANETTDEQQARNEIESQYTKQRDKAYFDNIDDVDSFEMFKPMLASEYSKTGIDFSNGPVFAQPKLDGMRCIARPDGLWSRSGKSIVSVPHITDALYNSPITEMAPNIILDGELYNHELKDDFNQIMSLCRKQKPTPEDLVESAAKIEYHIYDLYDTNNPDMSFEERTLLIDMLIATLSAEGITCIRDVETVKVKNQQELDDLYNKWLNEKYEGQMCRYDTPYENKRSRNLKKRKPWMDQEFPVIAMHEGTGNWAGAAKNFEIVLLNGDTMKPAVKGKYEDLAKLLVSGKTPNWAKVEFADYTPDGSLRFPRVIDFGYGKRED